MVYSVKWLGQSMAAKLRALVKRGPTLLVATLA